MGFSALGGVLVAIGFCYRNCRKALISRELAWLAEGSKTQ